MSLSFNSSQSMSSSEGRGRGGCLPRLPHVNVPHDDIGFVTFQFQLVFIFSLTQALHHGIFRYLGLPPMVSQITVGLLLSKASPLAQHIDAYKTLVNTLFPLHTESLSSSIGLLGYTLAIYIITVKMDFSIMWRSGRKSIMIGCIGMITAGCFTILTTFILDKYVAMGEKSGDLLTSATAVTSPHFPVVAVLLNDLGLMNSELGRLALSSSLVSETLSISISFLFIVVSTANVYIQNHANKVWKIMVVQFLGPTMLLIISCVVLRPLARWVIKKTPKDRPVEHVYVKAAFFVMLLGALLTDVSHQFVLLGAVIIGSITPDGPPLGSAVVDMLDFFVSGMLQPFFITTTVMSQDIFSVDLGHFLTRGLIVVCCVSTLCKILVCFGYGVYAEMAITDAFALGFLMDTKGIVDFGAYIMFMETKAISNETAQVLFLYAIMTALLSPIAVKFLYHPLRKYAGFQRRDVLSSCNYHRGEKPHDLKILSCIYTTDNIFSLTNLINIITPSIEENPVIIYTLHLVKLVGRSHPAFVSHDLQKKKASAGLSFSDDVVSTLDRFQHQYNNNRTNKQKNRHVSFHVYTAVSPPKAMHEDICTLALDKVTSLIVLPFHRKIGLDGSIIADNRGQRHLNLSVLDEAPCSVAVLVDRSGGQRRRTPAETLLNLISVTTPTTERKLFSVAVVYIGGNDDEESIALAMWMAKGGRAKVDVLRLLPHGGDRKLIETDAGLLVNEVKRLGLKSGYKYHELRVKSGAETATLLKELMSTGEHQPYDLVIVGRRKGEDCEQTAGLSQWNEVEELGVVGDILASTDIQGTTSVLIVQRQRLHRQLHRFNWWS